MFSVKGSGYKRCDFEEGFCDLFPSSETLPGWIRTTEVQGLEHDHSNNTSGGTRLTLTGHTALHFESTTVTSHSHLYTLSLFSLSVSTFPVPFTCERKQDHSRPDQSRLPAHSELPGNKTPLFLAYRKNPQQLHDNSFVVSSLNR